MTHYFNPDLSWRQNQIILGTILGGSSLIKPKNGKNVYLSMRSKDGQWLDWKSTQLLEVTSQEPVTIEKTNRWHSLCYPIFSDLRNSFFKNNKRNLTLEVLEKSALSDISFMIWFVDVGSYDKGSLVFNTNIWGEKGTKNIKKYFSLLDWDSEIVMERKGFRIKLDENSSKEMLKLISPLFPHFYAVNTFNI